MSRLNLEELDAVWVTEATDTLTFFYVPGESITNKKGEVSYKKKMEVRGTDKKKVEVPEEYLQVTRSEGEDKQILSLLMNEDVVATFEFTKTGVNFEPAAIWKKPKMHIIIPTDPTFGGHIVAETVSGLFKKWLQSKRFEEYLENQVSDSTYTSEFVNALLLFFAYLTSRDKVDAKGNIQIIKDGVDSQVVAHKYLTLLTKLHNSSPRAKKLFPIRPLLSPAVEPTTLTRPIEENKETEPIVDIVPEESILEAQKPVQETESQVTTLEPLPDTSLPIVEESKPEVTPEPKEEPKAKIYKKKATDELY